MTLTYIHIIYKLLIFNSICFNVNVGYGIVIKNISYIDMIPLKPIQTHRLSTECPHLYKEVN